MDAAPETGPVAPDVAAQPEVEEPPPGPDPAFFHVVVSEPRASAGDTWLADEPRQYRTEADLPGLDVTALSAASGVWAGTPGGLLRYDADLDAFVAHEVPPHSTSPVVDIAQSADPDGRVVVLTSDAVLRVDPDSSDAASTALAAGTPGAVAVQGDVVWVATSDGLLRIDAGGPASVVAPGIFEDVAVDSQGGVWFSGPDGIGVLAGADASVVLAGDTRGLAVQGDVVWAGTATGVARIEAGVALSIEAGVDGLPNGDVIVIAVAGERVALGHEVGATALSVGPTGAIEHIDHYAGRRWVPGDRVQAITIDGGGSVWLGTNAGITRVDWIPRTFEQNAGHFEAMVDAHFWRMDGFVSSDASTSDPWSPDAPWSVSDNDNDGLWTQMQIGAWCYAFAATGEASYRDKAKKAMDVMRRQIDVPAVDFEAAGLERGFVTRSLVRDDEGGIFDAKASQENWHLVEHGGRSYYWKDDTSSDETTGHFFGYPLYYDLCATEAERAVLAEYAGALAGVILDAGFKLIDLDGEQTTHGYWHPERIGVAADGLAACVAPIEYCVESWAGGGWLNSIEILGHMLAAWHMTSDPRFLDAYEELITVHGYDRVATPHEETFTITQPGTANHSDHELAMLAYHTLIRYEPDDERRALWIQGLLFLAEWEAGERNPLWGAFVSLLAGPEHIDVEAAVQSLREMPRDRRDLLVDNTHRKDAIEWPLDRFDRRQWDRVFPYDEIRTVWWNGNLRVMQSGGAGHQSRGPMAWLLPYWAFRYGGVIGP